MDPPSEAARLHRFAIGSTEEVVESLGALDEALRDNDPDAYLDAQLALADKLQELQDHYDHLSESRGTGVE